MYLKNKRETPNPPWRLTSCVLLTLCFLHEKEKFNSQIINEYPTYTPFTTLVLFFMKLSNYMPFSHMSILLPPKNAYMPSMSDKFLFQANSTMRKFILNGNNIRFGQFTLQPYFPAGQGTSHCRPVKTGLHFDSTFDSGRKRDIKTRANIKFLFQKRTFFCLCLAEDIIRTTLTELLFRVCEWKAKKNGKVRDKGIKKS